VVSRHKPIIKQLWNRREGRRKTKFRTGGRSSPEIGTNFPSEGESVGGERYHLGWASGQLNGKGGQVRAIHCITTKRGHRDGFCVSRPVSNRARSGGCFRGNTEKIIVASSKSREIEVINNERRLERRPLKDARERDGLGGKRTGEGNKFVLPKRG